MKKIYILSISIFVLSTILQGQNREKLVQAYSDSLDEFESIAYESNYTLLTEYLNECEDFIEFFRKEQNEARLVNYNVQSRLRLRNEIYAQSPDVTIKTILSKEKELYAALTHQLSSDALLYRLKARTILAGRKYFEQDDKTKGTILELWLNGAFKFTSTELTDLEGPQYGIKSWEINARFEPIGFIANKDLTGILFSFGTVYNFFPELNKQNDDVKIAETFFSDYIKRSGIKLGAGGRFEENFLWHGGLGVQIRAFTLWSLYSFENKKLSYAVGINDLSWVKFFIPYLNF